MSRKYFFENQSSLQRQFIAGGLTATFAFGTVGSGFAGAMEDLQQVIINEEGDQEYEPKNITKKELTDKGINVEANLDFIKKIDSEYEHWKKEIFGDESREKIRIFLRADDVEKFNKEWGNFPNKSAFIFGFLIAKKAGFHNSPKDTWEFVKGSLGGFFCGFLSLNYKTFFNALCACKKAQTQEPKLIVSEKNDIVNPVIPIHKVNGNTNNVGGVNIPFGNTEGNKPFEINTFIKGTESNPEDGNGNDFELRDVIRKKSLVHNKIIWGIGAGVVLILAIFLIVYFAIHGGKKQEISETVDPGKGQGESSQAGNNELKPTEQKHQTEENPGVVQGTGIGAKILKGSVVGATGAGLATSGTCLYGKMSSEVKEPKKQKAQNGNKEKDNGSFTYVDSLEKVVTNNEEKDSSSNINDAETDVSSTEQLPDFNDAEKSEIGNDKVSSEGKEQKAQNDNKEKR